VARFLGFEVSSASTGGEDRFHVCSIGDAVVIAVADGAGGLGHGDRAADIFIEAVGGYTSRDPFDMRAWTELFARCDTDVRRIGGETTALVVIVGALVAGVSVGDSEAWVVGDEIDRLTEKQSRARLGAGRARPTPFRRRSLDGVLVVGTDGLFKHASRDAIASACTKADPARRLVEATRLPNGGHSDDTTVLIVRREE